MSNGFQKVATGLRLIYVGLIMMLSAGVIGLLGSCLILGAGRVAARGGGLPALGG